MTPFELTILGSNSALPAYGRFPTSQILNIRNRLLLIDCGEGSQVRMSQYKIKRNRIEYVFISHLHGDHVYGLPGVITSFYHTNRTNPLKIFGPPGIKEFIETIFRLSAVHASFDLDIEEVSADVGEHKLILEDSDFTVHAFPVYHRVPTLGYRFTETPSERNIKKAMIRQYGLSIEQIKAVKQGQDISVKGVRLASEEMTHPSPLPRSYAYCADSSYNEKLIANVERADLLYFETTYLDELSDQAHDRGHATAREAGILARKAQVRQLVTGHYSSRYKKLDAVLAEVKSEFPNTILGYDGEIIRVAPSNSSSEKRLSGDQ